MKPAFTGIVLALFASSSLASCEFKPDPINYGHDGCQLCMMTITDERYGSELITDKGKVYKFDSIECLVGYLEQEAIGEGDYHSVLVTAYTQPGVLIEATDATYLKSKEMPSPMGAFLTAFHSEEEALEFKREKGGNLLSWSELPEDI